MFVPKLAAEVIEENEFTATYSDFNRPDTLLSCTPGYQGGFATPEVIKLKNHAIGLGFNVGHDVRSDGCDSHEQ